VIGKEGEGEKDNTNAADTFSLATSKTDTPIPNGERKGWKKLAQGCMQKGVQPPCMVGKKCGLAEGDDVEIDLPKKNRASRDSPSMEIHTNPTELVESRPRQNQ